MSSLDPKLSIPPFESTIPVGLLRDLTDKDRYLYTQLDEIGQATKWLSTQATKHQETLHELSGEVGLVKAQTFKTNGRTTAIEESLAKIDPEIATVRTAKRIVSSRYFIVGSVAFLLLGIPWLAAHAPGAAAFYSFVTGWFGI